MMDLNPKNIKFFAEFKKSSRVKTVGNFKKLFVNKKLFVITKMSMISKNVWKLKKHH